MICMSRDHFCRLFLAKGGIGWGVVQQTTHSRDTFLQNNHWIIRLHQLEFLTISTTSQQSPQKTQYQSWQGNPSSAVTIGNFNPKSRECFTLAFSAGSKKVGQKNMANLPIGLPFKHQLACYPGTLDFEKRGA